jgi:hypothetical protein
MPEEKISLADQIRDKLDAGVLPRTSAAWAYGGPSCGGAAC